MASLILVSRGRCHLLLVGVVSTASMLATWFLRVLAVVFDNSSRTTPFGVNHALEGRIKMASHWAIPFAPAMPMNLLRSRVYGYLG